MHETGIAVALLERALATAREHGLVSLDRVEVDVGVRRLVEPAALVQAFALAAEGTPADGAELAIREVPVRAACRACAADYDATLADLRCPRCGRAEPRVTSGDELLITSLSGDDGG